MKLKEMPINKLVKKLNNTINPVKRGYIKFHLRKKGADTYYESGRCIGYSDPGLEMCCVHYIKISGMEQ